MISCRKSRRIFSIVLAWLLATSAASQLFFPVWAESSLFDLEGKVYEMEDGSSYDYSSAEAVSSQANAFGTLFVSGNAKKNGIKNGFVAYEVNGGSLSCGYSFDKKQLEKAEIEWNLYNDSGKEVAGIKVGKKINSGAIIVQASLDSENWVTETMITDIFTGDSQLEDFYATKDIQLQNGCYFRIIIAYRMRIREPDGKFLFFDTKKYDYKQIAEVYDFYAISSEVTDKLTSATDTPRKELGKKINTGKDNGYSGEIAIDKDDPHYGWDLGAFIINGYTRETDDNGTPVFLKNSGDKVTLWFHLNQDINCLNNNTKLSVSEDTNGYDQTFEVPQTNFKHGAMIIRFTDYQGVSHDPIIYTDYLSANARTGADTRVQLFEEGNYEVALDYEIKNSAGLASYSNYKISFSFCIRNGNCMVFPMDNATHSELSDQAITRSGFKLDMAKSRYLTIDVQRSLLTEAPDGTLVEDVRFNRPAKDDDNFTDEGLYRITVRNLYTGESTTKTIYVGDSKYYGALSSTEGSVDNLNYIIGSGGIVEDDGTITIPENVPETMAFEPAISTEENIGETTPTEHPIETEVTDTETFDPAEIAAEEKTDSTIRLLILAAAGVVTGAAVVLLVKALTKKHAKAKHEEIKETEQ